MANALNVWMNGQTVGVWYAARNGVPAFRYDAAWIRSPQARALSLSLPITAGNSEHRDNVVANYFDNLLPDSANIRRRLSAHFKTKSTAAFDLLAAIGRDCVGAVQLLPETMQPEGWNRIESEPLTDDAIERILHATAADMPLGQPPNDDAGLRISIAGAQEKTALLHFGGQWRRPLGATPTTHILKLPLGLVGNMRADLTDSVENEWLCAQIVRELGLPVAHTSMAAFGKQKVLVVERFDRRWQSIAPGAQNAANYLPPAQAWIARLPQEDLCQATGTAPTLKYESDGGPTMHTCLDILAGSAQADTDRTRFALTQLAFWLLAATDGHAKNFSIFHYRGGAFGLTPLYDVISAWPIIGEGPNLISAHAARLAMALRAKNTHYKLNEIRARHWMHLAQRSGVPGVWERMLEMTRSVDAALERIQALLPMDFPPHIWHTVQAGIKQHANQFMREAEPAMHANQVHG
jgi:serine/threonine-protein kinase HipA